MANKLDELPELSKQLVAAVSAVHDQAGASATDPRREVERLLNLVLMRIEIELTNLKKRLP